MFVTSCISIYVCCHVNQRIQLLKMAGEWKKKNYYGKVSRYVSFQLLNWGPSSIRITINSCKNMRCADLWIVAFDRRLHLSFSHILLVVVVDWKAPIKRTTHKTGSYQQWQFDCFRFHIFFRKMWNVLDNCCSDWVCPTRPYLHWKMPAFYVLGLFPLTKCALKRWTMIVGF